MTTWDTTVDLVIIGSGGGGMVAALAAADAGASALVLEKQELIGGSTCMSGGILWVPNNPVMRADGVKDSYEDAMAHFEAVVGDVGPASSTERRHAFLTAGPGDGLVPPSVPACASRSVPATATTTRTPRVVSTSGAGSSPCRSMAMYWGHGSASSNPGWRRASGSP